MQPKVAQTTEHVLRPGKPIARKEPSHIPKPPSTVAMKSWSSSTQEATAETDKQVGRASTEDGGDGL